MPQAAFEAEAVPRLRDLVRVLLDGYARNPSYLLLHLQEELPQEWRIGEVARTALAETLATTSEEQWIDAATESVITEARATLAELTTTRRPPPDVLGQLQHGFIVFGESNPHRASARDRGPGIAGRMASLFRRFGSRAQPA